jgi:hypothetical protein
MSVQSCLEPQPSHPSPFVKKSQSPSPLATVTASRPSPTDSAWGQMQRPPPQYLPLPTATSVGLLMGGPHAPLRSALICQGRWGRAPQANRAWTAASWYAARFGLGVRMGECYVKE